MYKVVGADRREYGPVSRETVLEWIAQGRANAETIARFEEGAWKPLRTFEEFKEALGRPVAPPTIQTIDASLAAAPTIVTSGPEPPVFSGIGSVRKSNIPAIAGLVVPVICCCCPFGPLLGLILSILGYTQIKSQPNIYATPLLVATLGIVVSAILLGFQIVGAIFDSQLDRLIRSYLNILR